MRRGLARLAVVFSVLYFVIAGFYVADVYRSALGAPVVDPSIPANTPVTALTDVQLMRLYQAGQAHATSEAVGVTERFAAVYAVITGLLAAAWWVRQGFKAR